MYLFLDCSIFQAEFKSKDVEDAELGFRIYVFIPNKDQLSSAHTVNLPRFPVISGIGLCEHDTMNPCLWKPSEFVTQAINHHGIGPHAQHL